LALLTVGLATFVVFPRVFQEVLDYHAVRTARGARDAEVEKGMEKLWEEDYEGALFHIDNALSYWKSVTLLCVKAEIHIKLGQYDEALGCCDEVLAATPDFPKAHYLKGVAYKRAGKVSEAKESFQRAASLGDRKAQKECRTAEPQTGQTREQGRE
jgi:tetratricopeptide (TPR) repeat protein